MKDSPTLLPNCIIKLSALINSKRLKIIITIDFATPFPEKYII